MLAMLYGTRKIIQAADPEQRSVHHIPRHTLRRRAPPPLGRFELQGSRRRHGLRRRRPPPHRELRPQRHPHGRVQRGGAADSGRGEASARAPVLLGARASAAATTTTAATTTVSTTARPPAAVRRRLAYASQRRYVPASCVPAAVLPTPAARPATPAAAGQSRGGNCTVRGVSSGAAPGEL